MCCPLPFPPPQAGEGAGGGGGRTRKARQNSTLRLSAFRLRIFLSFFPVRHPCRSGACKCFHRHLCAAAWHGAPSSIGGDGSKYWRGIARVLKRIAKTSHCERNVVERSNPV